MTKVDTHIGAVSSWFGDESAMDSRIQGLGC